MKIHRLFLLALSLAWVSHVVAADQPPVASTTFYKLIAHRGGIVEDKYPDNCAAALQAAIGRGYWMIETDIRESKDGVLVMHHDTDFKTYFNDPRQVIDLTWDEIRRLHSDLGDQHPWRFEDLVKAARDAGMWLMLDSKDPHTAGFVEKVEAILNKYDMLKHCYIIGTADALTYFTGKAPVGLKFHPLQARIEADPASSVNYFLFDEGTMTAEMVRWAQARHIKVVPTVNIYHYYDAKTMAGKSRAELAPIIFAGARRDIEKFKALGITEFQIDSEFDRWLQPHSTREKSP